MFQGEEQLVEFQADLYSIIDGRVYKRSGE